MFRIILPIALAIFLSAAHFQITETGEGYLNPRNHLTQDASNKNEVKAKVLSVTEASSGKKVSDDEDFVEINPEEICLRLTWQVVPLAVKYKVFSDDAEYISYTTGIEIPANAADQVFQVTALDFDDNVLEENVKIISTELNPTRPLTTTEFDKMSFSPIYIVYSWIPTKDADHYEIQLIKGDEIVREFMTEYHPQDDNFDYYDPDPVLEDGEYYWRVRGLTADNKIITNWSERNDGNSFIVRKPARFCAIGDSITHGGGSISVPPSTAVYNWETYCPLPVKNLGKSGDTTEQILQRFDKDVLPFKPEILFVMAGVNDYRSGILGWHSVTNLKLIREKCEMNDIVPVFITPTPVNPHIMRKVNFVEPPQPDWQKHMDYICGWIRDQDCHIDVANEFADEQGNLREDLAVDGLHPDAEGKQIIGKAVGDWLNNYLDSLVPKN